MKQRILILAPGHPLLDAGGSETAAHALFEAVAARADHEVVFAARSSLSPLPGGLLTVRGRANEILVDLPPVDPLTGHSRDLPRLARQLGALLEHVRPDVVHMHHFHRWGLEAIPLIKQTGARLVFTFHEMMAICHNRGQMVKTSGALCHAASPAACAGCFPALHPDSFSLRTRLMGRMLQHLDVAICPSQSLAEHLRQWGGLGDLDLFVVENPLSPRAFADVQTVHPPRDAGLGTDHDRVRFGYFGRLSAEKGVVPLLKAVIGLAPSVRAQCHLALHGTGADDMMAHLATLTAEAPDCLHPMGAYAFGDVHRLMQGCDWVVVPSLWWENSPMVIQEALAAGKPVLCSGIGGMAEKIDPMSTGLHAAAGSVPAWQAAITQIIARRDTWPRIDRTNRQAGSDAALDAILMLYH